jgi:hypothetical protein
MGRRAVRLLLCAALIALAGAEAAAASSIVYEQDNNVWLMNPDGTGKYQVTLDGTSENAYRSPSQADDGTIVAIHTGSSVGNSHDELVRMHQNGSVIGSFTPDVTFSGGLDQADVSPDGSKVAYRTSFNGNGDCSAEGGSTFCYVMHVTAASGPTDLGGDSFVENPSWISGTRLLANESHQRIVTYDVGDTSSHEWFGRDIPAISDESIYDPDLRGTHVAAYKQTPYPSELRIYHTNGPPPALPTYVCSYTNPSGGDFNDPSFSPDGGALAFEESDRDFSTPPLGSDGIYVSPSITDSSCANAPIVAPGGEEPDWGPADVNPGERGGGNGDDTEAPDAGVGFVKVKLGKALKQGFFKAKVQTSEAGAAVLVAKAGGKVVARGSGGLPQAGTYSLKVKFTKKARKKYRHARKLKMKVRIVVADVAGNQAAGTRPLTLKR